MLCSPVLLYQMKYNRQPPLPKTFLLWLRLGIFFLLALSTFLVACTVHLLKVPATAEFSAADITAYFLRCVATIYLFVLTVFCALRGIITSGVMFFALLTHVVCGLEEFLECILYLSGYPVETADMGYIVYYVMLLMCFILTSFADKPAKGVQSAKAAPGKKPKRPVCPESTASFLSRCTFSYFDKIAWRGWRYGLQENDLWSLDEQNRVSCLKKKWEKHWKLKADRCILRRREQLKRDQTTLEEVAFLGKSESTSRNVPSIFWSLIISHCFYGNANESVVVWILLRFAFIQHQCGVFDFVASSLRLSYEARKDTTTGEIVNLMSVDVQKLVDVFPYIILFWSAPMQICIAIGSLWQLLGPSVMAGANQMKFKDTRIKMMNEILNGIRMLKFHAWELAFRDRISKIRQQELNVLRKGAIYGALTTFTWTVSPLLVAVASFATYLLSDSSHELTPQLTFVSLSLFNLLRFPVSMLPMLISLVIQVGIFAHVIIRRLPGNAAVSKKRLEKFLTGAEIDETMVQRDDDPTYAVRIEDGSFVWDQREKLVPNLVAINLTVARGQCVAIIGQVGSGKSSLCSAILGEMEKVSGILTVNGSISYVPQQAWILNGTVRSNILFTKPMKSHMYRNVIEACALGDEINNMIEKDETEIGEKLFCRLSIELLLEFSRMRCIFQGINLSGGQKQRLSLARAIYQDTDMYILDDPLSAVDSRVGRHIFDNVIGKRGLLRNKTRILVTNALVYLNEVDLIVIMESGTIKKVGTPAELLQRGQDVEQLLEIFASQKTADKNNSQTVADESSSEHGKTANNFDNVKLCPFSRSSLADDVVDGQAEDDSADDLSKSKDDSRTGNRLISTEVAETGSVNWHLHVFGILQHLACPMVRGYLREQIRSELRVGEHSNRGLRRLGCRPRVQRLHCRRRHAPLHGVVERPSARLAGVELVAFSNQLLRAHPDWSHIEPHQQRYRRSRQHPAGHYALLGELRDVGLVDVDHHHDQHARVRLYHHPARLVVLRGAKILRQHVPSTETYRIGQSFTSLQSFPANFARYHVDPRLQGAGSFSSGFATIRRLEPSDQLSPAGIEQITQTLNWVVRMNSDLETNIVSVERIKEYIELPSEVHCRASLVSACRPPPDWPNAGMVEFKNYSMRYRAELEPALKNISFVAQPREKVGIVGRTGAGKSSITLALFRIVEPDSGQIIIDGIDISTVGLHDLRSRLSIIPQEPVLLCGSLRMNLDPTEKRTDDELWTALEQVHLKSFVSSLPNKLEHVITEGGENLSVGQRQLVCLSRALLRKSRILVLDEATAAIDSETDALIQKTIRQCFKNCTVLTIAHRLNTVIDSDRILVLSKGQVIENDEPSKLMLNPSGEFQLLAKEFLNK
ncbi:putative ABC transporter, ATP-binding protein [Trichinella spiralis]|uniref:putative ABC transporter, ATP-binding protein n=1 Tax=Trichinella spiralis TaxID=6334 RepID=UPI0001EFE11F|nr:putative ABC transporter, ATP-binding protein [Trichinella spiralis]